jgi:YesN/AraC family two-component response regulator
MDLIKQLYLYSKDLDILFVEDDEELRNQMEGMFHELFNSVATAEDGKVGLAKYKDRIETNNKPYDLVITDINMPEMNGIEMIHAIYEVYPMQPVIVVSAHNESDYLMELLYIGINSFLIKPVKHQELITTLYKATKVIVNERLIEEHYKEIEELNARLSIQSEELKKSNEQMHEKNIALEKSMRIIEGMRHKDDLHRQIGVSIKASKGPDTKEEYLDTPTNGSHSYLSKIEEIISIIAQEYPNRKIEDNSLQELSATVNDYASSLPKEKHYNNLAAALEELGRTLASHPKSSSMKELDRILTMLESFFFIYTKWQKEWKNIDSGKFEIFSDSIEKEIRMLIDVWNCKI